MSKHGDTKERIIELISEGTNNLSGISEALGLAPSTVWKHLHELELAGSIRLRDGSSSRKWKYYEIGGQRPFAWKRVDTGRGIVPAIRRIVPAIILLIFISGIAVYAYDALSGRASYIPVSITDPPQVPAGTQALYINYSSLSLHLDMNGKSVWIPVNSEGRIDVMNIINESQVIGELSTVKNSSLEGARFNVTSASITIGNVTYPVKIMETSVSAEAGSGQHINSTSGVLLSFYPVVIPLYVNGEPSFVMLPTLKAGVGSNPTLAGGIHAYWHAGSAAEVKQRYPLDTEERNALFYDYQANISVENYSMSDTGNLMRIRIGLRNAGKDNITVMGIMLKNAVRNRTNTSNFVIAEGNFTGVYNQTGKEIVINASAIGSQKYFDPGPVEFTIHTEMPVNEIRVFGFSGGGFFSGSGNMGFFAYSNGTLVRASPGLYPGTEHGGIGYILTPGTQTSLSYAGMQHWYQYMQKGKYEAVILTDRGVYKTNVSYG